MAEKARVRCFKLDVNGAELRRNNGVSTQRVFDPIYGLALEDFHFPGSRFVGQNGLLGTC
jgi:hypothetical protein